MLKADLKILETQLLQEDAASREVGFVDELKIGALQSLGFYKEAAKLRGEAIGMDVDPELKKRNDLQDKINKLKGEQIDLELQLTAPSDDKDTTKPEKNNEAEIKAKAIEEITRLEDEYFENLLDKQTQEENAVYDKYFAQIEAAKQIWFKHNRIRSSKAKRT